MAKGAAYATGNVLTNTEFVKRGAALGVQMRQSNEKAWNDRAPILYCQVHKPLSPTPRTGSIRRPSC